MEISARLNEPIKWLACDKRRTRVAAPKKHSEYRRSTGSKSNQSAGILLQPALQIVIVIFIGLTSNGIGAAAERMVRLCIASVDPVKLSSQCVMCNRREFPLTVIDCTGMTKVNDLIANPLSVQEATCLIYNCRRQVPDVKPEPYHGSVSHAANYRGAASSASAYPPPAGAAVSPMDPSGSRLYEMMTPSGMFGGGYSMAPGPMAPSSPFMSRFGSSFGSFGQATANTGPVYSPLGLSAPRGLIGGPSYPPDRGRGPLPFALVPAPSTFPFGRNKYKMALMPLFR